MTIQEFFSLCHGKTIHIVGISGSEGSTIASFLALHKFPAVVVHDYIHEKDFLSHFRQYHDWMTVTEQDQSFQKIVRAGFTFHFQESYLKGIEDNDILFVPQSWFRYDYNKPLERFFHPDHSVKDKYIHAVWSLTKLYLSIFPGYTIGVTGSNGKSTTTALIASIIQSGFAHDGDRQLLWGGNDRKNKQPLCECTKARKKDVLLLEMSNRQLVMHMGLSPHIAVITNIVPNHLDDHGDFASYIDTKREIIRYQKSSDMTVLYYDNEDSRLLAQHAKGDVLFFSAHDKLEEGVVLDGDEIVLRQTEKQVPLLSVKDIHLPGKHNVLNVMAALGATLSFGFSPEMYIQAIRSFMGLPYRIEYVDTVRGIQFYDDSAGCNPQNISSAVDSFQTPVLIICGGYRKNPMPGEFRDAAIAFCQEHVKRVILIGSIQEFIKKELLEQGVPAHKIFQAVSLREAVQKIIPFANVGDSVVLAPGCESFGEFKDYRDRGNNFKTLVRQLKALDE